MHLDDSTAVDAVKGHGQLAQLTSLLAALAVVSAAILSLLGAALTLALIGHGQRAMVCLREVVK